MGALKFDKFGGQIPALDDLLLPMENAAYTENAFLQSGTLEPLAADIEIHVLKNKYARCAFRVPIEAPSIDKIDNPVGQPPNNYWIEFENPNTTVVRSPVNELADGGRYYWTNSSSPPMYTTKARLAAGDPPLLLGVPRPDFPPSVTIAGGTAPDGLRSYMYTWASASFEEGQPSPPSSDIGNLNGTWTLTIPQPGLSDTTDRALAYTNIYRTEVGSDGITYDFFLVDRIPISQTTYADSVPADIVASSDILESIDWAVPPEDLLGMVSMPNGMIAGWRDNEVWFCEPYRPHAWPVKYNINVDYPIVGLGTIDQNLFILTTGQPYVASGIHPSVMSLRQVQPVEPCTAPGSIVNTPQGVLYTSYNGLILIGPTGGKNLTFDIIRKDDWMRIHNLHEVHATYFMNGYYSYPGMVDGAFQPDAYQNDAYQMDEDDGHTEGAHISLADQRLGLMTLANLSRTFNVMLDQWTGETLVIRNERVYHVDRRMYVPRQSYKWKSKLIQTPYKENYAAVRIFFSQPNGPTPSAPTVFRYYAGSEGKSGVRLRFVKTLVKPGEQFRLPSGFRCDFIQFELEGQLLIHNMQIATSARELREV